MDGTGAPPDAPQPRGLAMARISLILALASLTMLCLAGLGAIPGLVLALTGWVLAYVSLLGAKREDAAPAVRPTARAALIVAVVGTLGNGLMLILYIASFV